MNLTTTVSTHTLDVPGASLYYELRGSGPLVVLIGAPMDAVAFAPLAERLATDYTVLTADPRGINRSSVDSRDIDSTPELRADDIARILRAVNTGPAAVFGSSGGAVSALALAQAHPRLIHIVVAHEAPLIELLADRAQLRRGTDELADVYLAGNHLRAWAMFIAQAKIDMPADVLEMMFGDHRDPQHLADELFWFAHEMRPSTYWEPDLDVLRASPVRIVVGVGEDSTGETCDRTSCALAAELGIGTTSFPGGHIAFAEDPDAFVGRLRPLLEDR
ncbi:alpha/beta fold hydrolase [Antrihabitans cavernicola]|uniref:Alpha/beta hydrolase n=1 Tax=Antrihabitans cavernicola TaxID=2495913 RepID=A0A5A7SAF6_9NOCA|nr:alpha/beta hydrolase [Spelaeibacter cavernicola]KAA0023158.1 alpha/beta hydrolase [Spelaeibacter cavernicola]